MSDIIKLLPDSVANQIAAGEVVQRPASVVKELIENAVDSGATEVKLIIKDAGKTLIQVIDNGCGMSPTDARLSFERHATSKISSANDLFQIRSKGFRGEALASIAAVAHVELKTKRHTDDVGSHLIIEGSKIILQEPVSCANGSTFSVKNIFFNIPARRNFLKSDKVEWKNIIDEFERVALTHPEIAFELHHNDDVIFKLPISNLKERILNIFGKNYNHKLAPIQEETSIIKIKGYIGKPEFAKKTRGEQFFFVNNRFIKSVYLNHAVVNAYYDLIEKNHHPSYFIYLDIDPSKIDVNIHPTKTEIKFEDEKAIYAILSSASRQAIGKNNLSPIIDFEKEVSFDVLPARKDQEIKHPKVNINKDYNPFNAEKKSSSFHKTTSDIFDESTLDFQNDFEQKTLTFESEINETEQDISQETLGKNLFQIHNRYIVSQLKSGIIIVDQRSAHKRILYEKLLKRFNNGHTVSQQLLFPISIDLNPSDFALLEDVWEKIRNLGFDIELFGKNTIVVNAMPYEIESSNVEKIFQDLLEQLKHSANDLLTHLNEKMAKLTANYSAISRNKPLSNEEMEHLISQLFSCENPYYTPNGKPTLKTFSLDDLNEIFD
jgi:DNA mismatch repair protein MutL